MGILSSFARPPLLVVRDEAIGIDDSRAFLSLADVTAKRERLPEGEPALAGEALGDDRAPENEDVDTRIEPAGGCVGRHADRGIGAGRAPRLDPGQPAGLQFRDDLGGNFIIEAHPFGRGACVTLL